MFLTYLKRVHVPRFLVLFHQGIADRTERWQTFPTSFHRARAAHTVTLALSAQQRLHDLRVM